MHPLMHEWAKVRMPLALHEQVYSRGLCILVLATSVTQIQQAKDRTLQHHISACLDHSVENEIPLNVARALYRLGNYLMKARSIDLAFQESVVVPLFNRILKHFHPGSHSELRLIAHELVSNGVPSQHMVLNGSDQAAEIDKSLDREREVRRSLAQCLARHRSLWNRMQLKVNQAREDYPLLDPDGLEDYFENMMETELFSPESPNAPFSKTDLQEFGAAVYHCRIRHCAQMLMKLNDYLRPFGEDLSDSPQPLTLPWSEIIIELDDLHIDVRKLYK